MEKSRSGFRGVVAGLLAATAVIAWFFFLDLLQGRPFATPAFLAATVLGGAPAAIGLGTIVLYTLIHYAAFIALGVAVAALVSSARLPPGLAMGVILGIVFFDLVFYTGLVLSGVDVLRQLGWPWVLIGNEIAGLTMVAWLRYTSPYEVTSWGEILRHHRIVREGIVAGVIGATAVAVWALLFDLVTRQILYTPAALGSALFYGANVTSQVQITAGTVLGYTVIHYAAFVAVGFAAAAMLTAARREPGVLIGAMLVFVTLEASFIGMIALFAGWILTALGGWNVAIGNVVAALAMGWYLWRVHPEVRGWLERESSVEDVAAR